MNQLLNAPALPEATTYMKIFYLVQFGKHFSRLVSHMFIRQEGNYYEYVLHHALSTFLILFSFLTNLWLIGIMVMLCHDLSDFFLILARGYKVKSLLILGLQKLLKANVASLLPLWICSLDWSSLGCIPSMLCICQFSDTRLGIVGDRARTRSHSNNIVQVDGIHASGSALPASFLDLLYR